VPTDFLKSFYTQAYSRIRAQAEGVTIVFHDGFRLKEWVSFFKAPDFKNIILDTHLYVMMHTITNRDANLDDYVMHIHNNFGNTVKEMSQYFPILVGEWCIDTKSPKSTTLSNQERLDYYRAIADAHFNAWKNATAWCYWSYKLHGDNPVNDLWDMGKAIELGLLPQDLTKLTA